MTESEIENEFKDLWTNKYYVLVKSDNPLGYTIHDEETGTFTIIERDKIAPYVIDKMINSGCKIYNSMSELPEPILRNKWENFDEWINFKNVANEYNLDNKDSNKVARYVGKNASKEEIISLIKKHIPRIK